MAVPQNIQNAFCLLWAVDNATAGCDAGWILINRSCYKLSTDAVTWMDAQANCTLDGSNLFSVSSLQELVREHIDHYLMIIKKFLSSENIIDGDQV